MLDRFFRKKQVQLVDRDGERYDVALRVLSRDLPDYRGVTLDLSRSGVQLETGGILQVGAEPLLKFEFDRGELESFECPARVVWSKQDETSRSKFRSGLNFIPTSDDERRQIARMATVLQTRSDSDLATLLDQARRVDPELERTFATVSSIGRIPTTLAEQFPARKPQKADSPPSTPPHPGVYIPMDAVLESYQWVRSNRTLRLGVLENAQSHFLYFPDCQLFQMLEPAFEEAIKGLYSRATSPATRKVELLTAPKTYKHYRFVGEAGKGLIDIVSAPCQPAE